MSEQSAENDAPRFAQRVANACACGDCYHPAFGPDTYHGPADWCRDCGCPRVHHTTPIPPGSGDAL